VRRADIFEAPERLGPDGSANGTGWAAAAELAERVAKGDYDSVAVVFLHAYANPVHEQRMADALCCPPARSTGVAVLW
jgi:N-methylhydantoinase A